MSDRPTVLLFEGLWLFLLASLPPDRRPDPCREILQEIQRLRLEHEQASQPTPEKAQQNPTLLTELRLLRYHVFPLSLLSGGGGGGIGLDSCMQGRP